MKTALIPMVTADFQGSDGVRIFTFALCRRQNGNGRLESIAVTRHETGLEPETRIIPDLQHKRAAIIRLSARYMGRSTPVRFVH